MITTTSHARRWMPASIAALVLSASLLAACGSTESGAGDAVEAAAPATAAPAPTAAPATVPAETTSAETTSPAADSMPMSDQGRTASQSALYQGMQTLWQQHMEWTYATIAAFATDSPTYPATVDRLLANQDDIGNALKPLYGDDAGDALTALLKDHITGVAAILTAAKAGDAVAQTAAVDAEYANARAIGDFLATANPDNWSKDSMEAMMETHIDQTLVYATDLLTGLYPEAIADYGEAEAHMVEMGDMLSAGVIAQFPESFTD